MLESSANGVGAADEAVAGREDRLGVAELGFGAGERAASEGVPGPELVEQAKRRRSTRRGSSPRRTRARGRVRLASCCAVRVCTPRI